ncbi:MAG: HlyD family type I secretion periplasmic adaptor subunit [Hyphomicrobiales bacterium]|nr:HlyD family type I secretion periplasmic adaptor subunit [Hyphomicrobiales bacterium]
MAIETAPASETSAGDIYATDPWVRTGNRVLIGLAIGLALFSLVTISGAVVATGVVNVESNYKTVQHLDGGIVARILVRNGDIVKEGDIVLRLDETAVNASHQVAVARANDLLVQQARLEAERDRHESIALPAEVAAVKGDTALEKLVATQRTLFAARRASHVGELSVLTQRRAQLVDESKAAERLLSARTKEVAINARELAAVGPLFEKGFASQQRYLPIQREAARLEGEIGRLTAEVSKAKAGLAEADLKLAQSEKEFTQQVVDELRKVQAQLAEVLEQRKALEDKLRRTTVRAPRAGRIHALAVHTEGGVVAPGSAIMQVVPEGERLVVDAQIAPQDIDKVRKGGPAQIRFPAFNAKSTPNLTATVLSVSPAQITDQQGRNYFTAQVALADREIDKLPPGHALVPGMPAEIYIETGSRSILSYFVKPLTDVVSRTFRES